MKSQGHALSNHIPSRKLEERFIGYSEKYFDLLRDGLSYSKYSEQRIVAAWAIAYYHDKKEITIEILNMMP